MTATAAQKKALAKARKVKKTKGKGAKTARGDGFLGDLVKKAWNAGKSYLAKDRKVSTAFYRAAPAIHDKISPELGNAVAHVGGLIRRHTAYGKTAPGLKKLNVGLLH